MLEERLVEAVLLLVVNALEVLHLVPHRRYLLNDSRLAGTLLLLAGVAEGLSNDIFWCCLPGFGEFAAAYRGSFLGGMLLHLVDLHGFVDARLAHAKLRLLQHIMAPCDNITSGGSLDVRAVLGAPVVEEEAVEEREGIAATTKGGPLHGILAPGQPLHVLHQVLHHQRGILEVQSLLCVVGVVRGLWGVSGIERHVDVGLHVPQLKEAGGIDTSLVHQGRR